MRAVRLLPSLAVGVELGAGDAAGMACRAAWQAQPTATPAAIGCGSSAAASGSSLPSMAPWQAAGPSRGIWATSRPQHNAQPAASLEQEQQQARTAPPQKQQGQRRPEAQWQVEHTCWQCGTRLSEHDLFFCPSCNSVQPASGDTQHFQVFDIDAPRFELHLPTLEARYKALQRVLHPDKFSTASSLEQEYAHQQAAVVNQAYDVLKKPLRRAHYILNQAGFGACEGMTITDPELLMYVMEAREEVESTSDAAALRRLLDQNAALEARCLQELAAAFSSGDLQHAAELTTQLRYICRIKEAIVDKI